MKNIMKKGICLLLILLMVLPSVSILAQEEDTPTVFIIGDSTAATYSEARAPRTGWGQVLHNFFKDGYMVKNYAQSGASAHSCYDSFWQTVKMQIKPGDYLLIQFGHNDSAKSGYDDEGNTIDSLYRWGDPTLESSVAPPEGELTDNPDDYSYKWYLKQFADYATGIGAHPIFVTSVERRDHAIERANDADSGLYPWVKAMKDLATDELNIPVIDVWTEVRTLVKNMEKEKENSTKELYMHLQPGEYSYYPDGTNDNTHLSLKGALKVAGIFANLLEKSNSPLKNYLVDDVDSITANKILPEKVDEDFYGAELGIIKSGENYNSWYVSGDSDTEKSPYIQIVYEDKEKTNKAINFYRDATLNSAYDESILKAEYVLKNPLGADAPSDVTDEERYVRLKYKFRSDTISSGFTVAAGGMQITVEPSGSYLRVKRDTPVKVNKPITFGNYKNITIEKWYDIEVYYDLKMQKISTFVDKNRLHTEENLGSSKIENISMSSVRYVSTTIGTWSYFVDDIELSVIDEDTYCDYVGVMPDETYVMKETYNIYDEGRITAATWNGWSIGNSTNAVSMVQIADDPTAPNSSNKTLAFQRTGIPSGANKMTKTFSETVTDGYAKLSIDLLKNSETDKWLELFVYGDDDNYWGITFDFSAGQISTYKQYNNTSSTSVLASFDEVASGYRITKGKWYKFELIYDLTGDNGALTAYVNGRKIIDDIKAATDRNGRKNNGTIKKLSIGLNRTDGSTTKQYIKDDQGNDTTEVITNVDYSGNGTLIADVRLDNLELKYVTTEPLSLIYSNDGNQVSGVKIKNERVANANEKMLVAVYSNDTVPALKGVSECEAITYGKTELSLKIPLSVNQGDKIKLFFWDMINLLPKGYLEATK